MEQTDKDKEDSLSEEERLKIICVKYSATQAIAKQTVCVGPYV